MSVILMRLMMTDGRQLLYGGLVFSRMAVLHIWIGRGWKLLFTFAVMEDIKHINSLQNDLIKKILVLKEKSRERKKTGLFVLEGLRELQLAVRGRYSVAKVLFLKDLISETDLRHFFDPDKSGPELISISNEVYKKLAYRESTEGIIALIHTKTHTLEALAPKINPLILVAEAPEKPGNIGALLRTADAARLDAVIIANPKTDLYNPNIIRSSVGCLFTSTIATGTTSEVITFLRQNKIAIYCAALTASKNYVEIDFNGPSAIVVGTESTGLSEEWLDSSDQNIIIPMQGEIDSLNVSVSAAILIFEAARQRGF